MRVHGTGLAAGVGAALAALLAAGCATASPPARPALAPLRGHDCLDPSSARSWDDVSTNELHVDAGRRRYRLYVASACTRLGTGPVLRFDGDPISGRVCGAPGDAVIVDGQRCPIDRIEIIDDTLDAPDDAAADGTR